jgi:ABC-type phosphate transport system auxiliary subunit
MERQSQYVTIASLIQQNQKYIHEIITIGTDQSKILSDELKKEYIYSLRLLTMLDDKNHIFRKNFDTESVATMENKKDWVKQQLDILTETIKYIDQQLCKYVILFKDDAGRRLISMCVLNKINQFQFHANILTSIRTTVD